MPTVCVPLPHRPPEPVPRRGLLRVPPPHWVPHPLLEARIQGAGGLQDAQQGVRAREEDCNLAAVLQGAGNHASHT